MWSYFVVIPSPCFDNIPGFLHRAEPVLVQALISEPADEALGVWILYRLGDASEPIERTYVNEIQGYDTPYCGNERYPFDKVAGVQLIMKEGTVPSNITNCGQLYATSTNKLYFIDGDGTTHEVAFA